MPRSRKRKPQGPHAALQAVLKTFARHVTHIDRMESHLADMRTELKSALIELTSSLMPKSTQLVATKVPKIRHVELRGDPSDGHREVIINRKHRTTLRPQAFLFVCALALEGACGAYVSTAKLLDRLRKLLMQHCPDKDWHNLDEQRLYSMANLARQKLGAIGFAHLLPESECKGAGYLLNAPLVVVPPAVSGR